jgi:type 1 glutamine amidotransferase
MVWCALAAAAGANAPGADGAGASDDGTEADPLRVLIITGMNNHDWKATTPVLESILEGSGRFEVDVNGDPRSITPASLEPYDAILSNYNTWVSRTDPPKDDGWSDETRDAYLDFVRDGGGHVAVHAGSSSFYDWPAYQDLVLTGFKVGVTDHGTRHTFPVKPVNLAHPIMRGMGWFETYDELWDHAPVRAHGTVLADAYSSVASNGSGRWEQVAVVGEFGKGRTFTTLLGHEAKSMESEGFRALLLRGTEWAASGEVTLPPAGMHLETDEENGEFVFTDGDREVLRFRYAGEGLFKPYVREMRTPSGINVLLDSPSDHIHHHGLMLALGVGDVDFWGEIPPDAMGIQAIEEPPLALSLDAPTMLASLEWKSPAGDTLAEEVRSIEVRRGSGSRPTIITWNSALTLVRGLDEARLWGRHYFGLGMRFIHEMDAGGFIFPPESEGRPYRGDERLTRARWCAYRATAEGRPVTVAMFDPGTNQRSATWFTMATPFAYLAATPNFEAQPRTLRAGEAILFRYAVAVWDGHIGVEEIGHAHMEWAARGKGTNLAHHSHATTAHASSEHRSDNAAGKAIDGRTRVPDTDIWISAAADTRHHLRLDLGQPRAIATVIVHHAGALPMLDAWKLNTAEFRIQAADDPAGPWHDLVDPIRGNTDDVTIHELDPTTSRHLRLLIESPDQEGGDQARIAEIEVFGPDAEED